MIRLVAILAVSLVAFSAARRADRPKQSSATLERMLCGQWEGGPCEGDWTFAPDHTYRVTNYSPGGNKLSGLWEVRWDALPPTLVLTRKTSDDPVDLKVGEKTQVRLIQLDGRSMRFQYLSQYQQPGGHTDRFERVAK